MKEMVERTESSQLKKDIQDAKGSIYERKFGPGLFGWHPLGNVSFVKITTENSKHLPHLLNELDKQETARNTSEVVNYFVGGPFILSQTGKPALAQHRAYAHSLNHPSEFIRYMLEETRKFLTANKDNGISLKEFVSKPTTAALIHGMFNIPLDQSPELARALNAFSQIGGHLTPDFYEGIIAKLKITTVAWINSKIASFLPSPLSFNSNFRNARNQYIAAAENFLLNQTDAIYDDIKNYAQHLRGEHSNTTKSILTYALLEFFKSKPELSENKKLEWDKFYEFLEDLTKEDISNYLIDHYIRTIPASVAAGENIVAVNTCALVALAQNQDLLKALREELSGFNLSFDDSSSLQKFIMQDRSKNNLLHRVYLESLRREDMLKSCEELKYQSNIWRYTNKDISFGEEVIHSSTVAIINGMPRFDQNVWQAPQTFDPDRFKTNENGSDDKTMEDNKRKVKIVESIFSEGNRVCPGKNISPYLAKIHLAYFVLNYNWNLEYPEDSLPTIANVKIRFERRLENQKNRVLDSNESKEESIQFSM